MDTFAAQVRVELAELAKLGTISKTKADRAKALATPEACAEYDANGMSISEMADLFVALA